MDETLVFGRAGGDRVEIGPFRSENGYRLDDVLASIEAEVAVWQAGEVIGRRCSANGFEARAILNLRVDLHTLRDLGRGQIRFGDHDWGSLVELEATGVGVFALQASLPDIGRWSAPVATLGAAEIDDLIAAIDRIEGQLGDLSGYLGCCGRPDPTFQVTDPNWNIS